MAAEAYNGIPSIVFEKNVKKERPDTIATASKFANDWKNGIKHDHRVPLHYLTQESGSFEAFLERIARGGMNEHIRKLADRAASRFVKPPEEQPDREELEEKKPAMADVTK